MAINPTGMTQKELVEAVYYLQYAVSSLVSGCTTSGVTSAGTSAAKANVTVPVVTI